MEYCIDRIPNAEVTMTTTMNEPITIHHAGSEPDDLQQQAKEAHWNVKGPSFIALHDLFEREA